MCWPAGAFARRQARLLHQLSAEARAADKESRLDGDSASNGAATTAAAAGGPPAVVPADLPACVRRYLELAGALGGQRYTLVRGRQVGQFKYNAEESTPWQTLDAAQAISPCVPAFLWSARCSFKPLIGMRGLDARLGGRGCLDWRLWGWLPAHKADGPLLDASLLARWLAEAPGAPQALLPSRWLRWEAVPGSACEARAVVSHGGASASGVFAFDPDSGLVISFRSEDYVMPLPGGGEERRTWLVRYGGHRAVRCGTPSGGGGGGGASLFVPTEGSAARLAADGRELPFVRFRLEGAPTVE